MKKKVIEYRTQDGFVSNVFFFPSIKKNAPLIFEIHGGGFIWGSNRCDENLCMLLNSRLDYNVASVEYRLAPKAVFPTATQDSLDALDFLVANSDLDFDRENIFLFGHSAGANIAVGINLLKKSLPKIKGIVLSYPFIDCATAPKMREKTKYRLPGFMFYKIRKMYFKGKTDLCDPLVSPIFMSDEQIKKMPPSLIFTSQFDSLRSDGKKLKSRMDEHNIPCGHFEYENTVHGYMEDVPNGRMAKHWYFSRKIKNFQYAAFDSSIDEIEKFILKNIN